MEKGDDWSVVVAAFGALRKTPRFFALARENATAPVLTSASRNGNDRFSDRGADRARSSMLDESAICHNLLPFTRRREWPVQFFFRSFFPMGLSDLPRAKVTCLRGFTTFEIGVYDIFLYTIRRRKCKSFHKSQYRSLRVIYLTLDRRFIFII